MWQYNGQQKLTLYGSWPRNKRTYIDCDHVRGTERLATVTLPVLKHWKFELHLRRKNCYHTVADNNGHRLLSIGNREIAPRYDVSNVTGCVWKISSGNCKLIVTIRVKKDVKKRKPKYVYRVIRNDCGVLTTCRTQYTWDRSICSFYLIEQHSKFLLHSLQVLYMCTLCDSTNINTIIEFVPTCL